MKSKSSPLSGLRRNQTSQRSARGIALVLVLAILLLITGFVLAFYSSVSSELISAKSYAGGSSGKQLADAATQLAIGTIRKATSQTSQSYNLPNANSSGTDIAWASQPGMIRTWDRDGNALRGYKLFSSNSLEVDLRGGTPYNPTSDIATDFDTKPALFTDLNAPITLPQDPNAVRDDLDPLDPYHTMHYPIVDPSTAGSPNGTQTQRVQGFVIDPNAATTPTQYTTVKGTAPMPVRWIYVLQDGTMTTPTGGTTTATFSTTGTSAPTAANPIVGRMAYWTDDETCKVNVNTASEGVYWDVPHLVSQEDLGNWNGYTSAPSAAGLSVCQPATGEYQRYAGHPATTSLSPVLGGLIPALAAPDSSTRITPSIASTYFKPYYDLIPRVTWGGSQAGTVIPRTSLTGNEAPLLTDSDRLFASVDEFVFKSPTHSPGTLEVPRLVNPELATDPAGMAGVKQGLERAKFFLTAHSSAPEVTMFNTPRVSMWPVWAAGSTNPPRTVLDSTLAFCASLKVNSNESPYYFTRTNSRSTTADYQDPSNVRLYAYLKTLMSKPIPGFGGTFNASFQDSNGDDTAQVLTNIYDYIRCINMYDKTTGAKPYTQPVRIGSGLSTWGGGEVLPIQINLNGTTTQGFGRFGTLSGMDIVFSAIPANPDDSTPGFAVTTKVQAMLVPTFFSPMQGLPGMFPHVYYTITGQSGFKLNGTPIFYQPTSPGGAEGTNWIANAPVQQNVGRGMGSMISPRASLGRFGPFVSPFMKGLQPGASIAPPFVSNPPKTLENPPTTVGSSGYYPFVSLGSDGTPNIPLSSPLPTSKPGNMSFTGGTLTVKLYAADTYPGTLLQTFTLAMPSATLPVPTANKFLGPLVGSYTAPNFPTSNRNGTTFSAQYDVVRGVEIAGRGDTDPMDTSSTSTNTSAGDVRMIAARANVPATYYHAHQNWALPSLPLAASGMEDDDGSNSNLLPDSVPSSGRSGRGSHGALAVGMHNRNADFDSPTAANPSYGYKSPYVPLRAYTSGLMGVTRTNNDGTTPGDWDTGYALLPDGAHINMGDTGDGAYIDEVTDPYPGFAGKPRYPYVVKEDHFHSDLGAGTYFSPNRQVPSSMMLGSIPTGVQRFEPWQTLLFNPKPEDPNHPGRRLPANYAQPGTIPPDHLIADFFWMPVVQPYPISQPFSTAGKINMNYQIEPFNYIKRATGIYAVLKSTKMMAIPASTYKYIPPVNSAGVDPKPLISFASEATAAYQAKAIPNARLGINIDETIKGFDDKFATNDIFRSASQISEINLVPVVTSGPQPTHDTGSMAAFWNAHTMSGDNLREKPYVDIYPRLTTKSNAYTVHFRVQVLQKSPNTLAGQWVEGKDQVVSEYRGSSEIERYLDSTDANLPDFATLMATDSTDQKLNLDKFYRYRIVSTKRFSPY